MPSYLPQHAGTVPAGNVTSISSECTPAVGSAAGGGAGDGGADVGGHNPGATDEDGPTVTVLVSVAAGGDELLHADKDTAATTSTKSPDNLPMNRSLPHRVYARLENHDAVGGCPSARFECERAAHTLACRTGLGLSEKGCPRFPVNFVP